MVKKQCGKAIEIYYEGRDKEMKKVGDLLKGWRRVSHSRSQMQNIIHESESENCLPYKDLFLGEKQPRSNFFFFKCGILF